MYNSNLAVMLECVYITCVQNSLAVQHCVSVVSRNFACMAIIAA